MIASFGHISMTKADNEKYVKRGADMFIEYNPEWEGEVNHTNEGNVGAPYRYSETLIMLAAAHRVGMGVARGHFRYSSAYSGNT